MGKRASSIGIRKIRYRREASSNRNIGRGVQAAIGRWTKKFTEHSVMWKIASCSSRKNRRWQHSSKRKTELN
jgi:hypothetical protein